MKMINWYTISLVIISCVSLLFSITQINVDIIPFFLVIVAIVTILEISPIRLISGDQYAAGSIGFLFLLTYFGFSYSIVAIYIATIAYYLKTLKHGKPPLVKLFVTIGMYVVSIFFSYLVWTFTSKVNVFLAVVMISIVFEIVNFLLLEGVESTVFGKKMFTTVKTKLMEILVTAFISIIVLSRLVIIKSELELIFSLLYSMFFLIILNFFSREYMKQFLLRKSTSTAFIQVLEGRITPGLAGHGNRVGIICNIILEDLGYPKRARNDLVQAAIIHDIGKALLPSYIFRKKGDMTLSEEREYKTHPEKAVEIVKTISPKDLFSDCILYHHERWDGKGFPKGLKGEEIPLGSRIIALANELDHIITRNNDKETVFKLLKEKSGTLLDPKLVEIIELHHIEMILIKIQPYQAKLNEINELASNPYSDNATFSNIGESFFMKVKNGIVHSPKEETPIGFVQALSEIAIKKKETVHETYIQNGLALSLHAKLEPNGEVTVFAHDLVPYLEYRRNLEQNILESYVDVINTLSDEKIKLYTSKKSIKTRLGKSLANIQINTNSDVPKSRELTMKIMEQIPTEMNSMKVQVAISEAVTNILKHATSGELSIHWQEDVLQFFISDKGSGIPLHEIPKTILVSGYSSKRSLGQGFKMISTFSDGVYIFTSSEGTSILIEYKRKAASIKDHIEVVK